MSSWSFSDCYVFDYIFSTLITLNLRCLLLFSVDVEGLSSGGGQRQASLSTLFRFQV